MSLHPQKPQIPMVQNLILYGNSLAGWCIKHQKQISHLDLQEVMVGNFTYLGCPLCYGEMEKVGAKRIGVPPRPMLQPRKCYACDEVGGYLCKKCTMEMCDVHRYGEVCLICAGER